MNRDLARAALFTVAGLVSLVVTTKVALWRLGRI